MTGSDLKSITEAYLAAFEQRDVDSCAEYFTDDASIDWPGRNYVGSAEIRQWHVDRIAANMQVVQVRKVRVESNKVVADVVAVSDRLKQMGINRLGGRITLAFRDSKVTNAKFGVRFQR